MKSEKEKKEQEEIASLLLKEEMAKRADEKAIDRYRRQKFKERRQLIKRRDNERRMKREQRKVDKFLDQYGEDGIKKHVSSKNCMDGSDFYRFVFNEEEDQEYSDFDYEEEDFENLNGYSISLV